MTITDDVVSLIQDKSNGYVIVGILDHLYRIRHPGFASAIVRGIDANYKSVTFGVEEWLQYPTKVITTTKTQKTHLTYHIFRFNAYVPTVASIRCSCLIPSWQNIPTVQAICATILENGCAPFMGYSKALSYLLKVDALILDCY